VSPAPPSSRARLILGRFPRHLELEGPGKAMGSVTTALANPLDVQTVQAGDVRRSHRLADARTEIDLVRLGGLHGLTVNSLAVLRERWAAAADAGAGPTDPDRAYQAWLDLVRATLGDLVEVHTVGNGTPAGLLSATAAYLGMTVTRVAHSTDRWWHLATCADRIPLPGGAVADEALIALEENPFRLRDIKPVPRRHGERFRVLRSGFEAAPVSVIVRGVEDRCLRPMVVDIDRGEGLTAEVTVPAGADLRFERDGRVTLSASSVAGRAWRFRGAVFADTDMAHAKDFVWADAAATDPPTSDPSSDRVGRFAVTEPVADAFDPSPSLPHLEPLVAPLVLAPGESRWAVFVGAATYSGRRDPENPGDGNPGDDAGPGPGSSGAVTAAPRSLAGFFDETVFAPDPAGGPAFEIGFEWDEREPFAVRVWLPLALADLDGPDETPVRERTRGLLDRHRAAGVHVRVDYADPRWILGAGSLRDLETDEALGVVVSGTSTWQDGTDQPPPSP